MSLVGLSDLEQLRSKMYSANRFLHFTVIVSKVLFWCFAAMFCYGALMNIMPALSLGFLFALVCLLVAGSVDTFRYSKLLKYKKEIKQKVYKIIFEDVNDFEYESMTDSKVSELFDKLQELNLFGSFSRLVCDDCFVYKSDDITCKIYDIGVYNIATGYKTKITRKIFEGMLIVSPSFKKFSGVTVIKADKKLKTIEDISTSLERINFEDVVFEKFFDVYSTDQIEARYLLTTAFMERLVNSVSKEGKQIVGSFEKGNVYIGVESKEDLFELDLSKPLTDKDTFVPLIEELKQAAELVKALKLENKTGM